jgi:aminoglycoside/choline kinase family phosphotransferase
VLAVYPAAFDAETLPFVNVARLLQAMPLPVPAIRGHAGDLGVLALDDLGDVTLQAHLAGAAPDVAAARYREAVSLIEILQRRGRDLADARYVPYRLAFDEEKLMWEMDFFITHFLEGFRGAVFTPAAREHLRAELAPIVSELAAEPRVLCHRDYHSRNLMWSGGRLHVIDFQDARLGPDTYDLVSLLRDSYVDLPDTLTDSLVTHYLDLTGRTNEREDFLRRFDVMALQRNLKALGTFGYQTSVRGNPGYQQYVPRTAAYASRTLARHPRFAALRALLTEHLQP